jgi:glycerophosphoryl diester phosphodiesterase
MIVIAHRGSCMEALENSFAAFDLALKQGAQRIEFDVQVTKDGQALVIHDANLKRTAQKSGRVSQLTSQELRSIKLKNSEAIPFLEEVIERYKGKLEFNIELKGAEPDIADAVANVLRKHKDILDDVIVSSFKYRPLMRMKELMPEVKLACLWGPDIEWPFLGNSSPLKFMEKTGAKILHPWVGYVNPQLMTWAKQYGWQVFAYADRKSESSSPEAVWENLLSNGVDGLCTNWPVKFSRWVKDHQSV